jgi:hypothetical protein
MKLLGSRNWYFPKWLEWIPNISIEGHLDDPDFEVDLSNEVALVN